MTFVLASDGTPPPPLQQASFRSSTLAVRVDVLVTDGHKPVAGLTARDFDLRDNGVAQSIELLDAADLPVNVVLALDTSGSMTGRASRSGCCERGDARRLLPVDRAALTTFSHAVMPGFALTGDLDAVREALRSFTPSGLTAVMDGVYVALTTTLAQSGARCRRLHRRLGCFELAAAGRRDREREAIERRHLCGDVGRRAERRLPRGTRRADRRRHDSRREEHGPPRRVRRILREFRSRYILSYTPTGVPLGGSHRLDVRLKRRGLTLKARPGYIGVEPDR